MLRVRSPSALVHSADPDGTACTLSTADDGRWFLYFDSTCREARRSVSRMCYDNLLKLKQDTMVGPGM